MVPSLPRLGETGHVVTATTAAHAIFRAIGNRMRGGPLAIDKLSD